MKATTKKAVNRSDTVVRLDTVRMSESERWHAYEGLRQGEIFAGFVLRAVADLRAIAHGVEHASAIVLGGVKAMLAKPIKH